MSKTLKAIVCFALVVLIFVGGLYIINGIELHEETEQFNNGICTECGGHLLPSDSAFDRASGATFHYFTCDKCHAKYAFKFIGEDF